MLVVLVLLLALVAVLLAVERLGKQHLRQSVLEVHTRNGAQHVCVRRQKG